MTAQLDRGQIREQFIASAKRIMDNRGPQAVSVRSVAKEAGYSYATIYNYFADIYHLLWHVSLQYRQEIAAYMQDWERHLKAEYDGPALIGELFAVYADYFLRHPAVFQFLFLCSIAQSPEEQRPQTTRPSLLQQLTRLLDDCAEKGYVPKTDVEMMASCLDNMLQGILTSYFANSHVMDAKHLFQQVRSHTAYLFRKTASQGVL